jgi:hypothetical protein
VRRRRPQAERRRHGRRTTIRHAGASNSVEAKKMMWRLNEHVGCFLTYNHAVGSAAHGGGRVRGGGGPRRGIAASPAHNRARNDHVHHQCDSPKLLGPDPRPHWWRKPGSTTTTSMTRAAASISPSNDANSPPTSHVWSLARWSRECGYDTYTHVKGSIQVLGPKLGCNERRDLQRGCCPWVRSGRGDAADAMGATSHG